MKQCFPILVLLALAAGCTKLTEYNYAVICDFPAFSSGPAWLVVSNDAGTVLKTFDLPAGGSHFSGELEFQGPSAPEHYNLHLIRKNTSGGVSTVLSCYMVQNGAPVVFLPAERYAVAARENFVLLSVQGIAAVQAVDFPGSQPGDTQLLSFNDTTQTATIFVLLRDRVDFVMRIRTAASAPFRSLYLTTDTLTGSMLRTQWADYAVESDILPVELPRNRPVNVLDIAAITPDSKRFATVLAYANSSSQLSVVPPDQVSLPADLPAQTLFRVKLQQGDYTTEKIFKPGEALRLEENDLHIHSAVITAEQTIEILTSGAPDLIEANIHIFNPANGNYIGHWKIQGPPETYQHLVVPNLTALLPGWSIPNTPNDALRVQVYKYDQLDYRQLLAGFPFKGGDGRVFPIARSGLQMLTVDY